MKAPDENNDIFQLATDFINQTSEHIFLTGKAGTGKTTFLKHIRKQTHKITVVTAPTGVAAINAGGTTLHSLFQLPFEPFLPGISSAASRKNRFSFSKQKLDLIRQLELLIIDEVSMLRADTLDAIDASLRRIRHNSRPFGGVQMLYIGDLFQLPPVAKDDEWNLLKDYYPSTFFFHSHALTQTQPIYIELKKVYRQGDPVFVNLLNRVRNNLISIDDINALNARHVPNFAPADEEKYITLTTHNYKADQINSRKLAELPVKEYILAGEITGDFPEYSLPTDVQLKLKEGAQIMFIKNDMEDPRRYYNGKIATVSRIVDNKLYVFIPELGSEIEVTKEVWKNVRYTLDKESGEIIEDELGTFVQYPVRLAWAITIHKSQGLTFEKAIIDIGSSFAAGQAYVALSRCTTLEGIVMHSRIRPGCVMTDPHAINFSKGEKEQEELNTIFKQGKRKFWAERLLQYYDWKQMYLILREMEKLLDGKDSDEYAQAHKLLKNFRKEAYGLENVSIKFQSQLTSMIQQNEQEDLNSLQNRCQKGILYFSENVIEKILKPLQEYIIGFKSIKKAKTFYKNLNEIEEDIILFLENMKRVRYNNIALAEDLQLVIPKRRDIFSKSEPTEKSKKEKKPKEKKVKEPKEKKEKPVKENTFRISLEMFKNGQSIEEISNERNLAISTIEGHLATFIKIGELPVEKFLSPDDLKVLVPLLEIYDESQIPPFKMLFEELSYQYSFGQLKMAFNHVLYLKKSTEKE